MEGQATTSLNSAAVFDITELLENVLLNLPTKDLLRVQRVSQCFKRVISTSLQLQRRLFITPVRLPVPATGADYPITRHMNPLLFETGEYHGTNGFSVEIRFPLLQRHQERPSSLRDRMLVCQPPCTEVSMFSDVREADPLRDEYYMGTWREWGCSQNPNGIRWGNIMEAIDSNLRGASVTSVIERVVVRVERLVNAESTGLPRTEEAPASVS